MKLTSIGMEIVRRELEGGAGKKISVIIGKPEPFPDGADYYCPFTIEGMGDQRVRYAGGIDSIQALHLAMKMIGAILSTSEMAKRGELTWLGNQDFGFPLADALKTEK